ncbi:MAG: hypothetical protein HZB16_15120 [Armatimonadetes bacterium]|nr:hypothetical protein [Armatimonadota bacterium]
MTDLAALCRAFAYNRWANRRACEALDGACREACPSGDDRPVAVPGSCAQAASHLGHLLVVEKIWMERLRGVRYEAEELYPAWTAAHCADMAEMLGNLWPAQVNKLATRLDQPILYPGEPEGEMREASPRTILSHVLHHSTEQRTLMCDLLRRAGHTPPRLGVLDFEQECGPPPRSRRSRSSAAAATAH